jgi:hypothetical protein
MLFKPLHPFSEMESTFITIKTNWVVFCMGVGPIKLQVTYLMFVKYAKYSFFMLLKPLHLLDEMESTFDIIKKIGLFFVWWLSIEVLVII